MGHRENDLLIAPLISAAAMTALRDEGGGEFTPAALKISVQQAVGLRAEGPAAPRVRFFQKRNGVWGAFYMVSPAARGTIEIGVAAMPGVGPREFTVRGAGWKQSGVIAPVLLASSLDPADSVFVVRNTMTETFAGELAKLLSSCDGKPALIPVSQSNGFSDLWIQDAVEFGVSIVPGGRGHARQTVSPLLGLRGKHDMGLDCAPLDDRVADLLERNLPEFTPVRIGEPLPKRRWIDWYGNLEVSPPCPGFPFGRVLTGEQKGLQIHPDLLKFLEDQNVQWPPLFLDVSWLTIGHVDELINFVPARGGKGFRALLPSPILARTLLENAVKAGHGDAPVFAGTKKATTVTRLLDEVAKSPETDTIEKSLADTRDRLREGLGLEASDIVEMPVLFKDGLPVVPNGVNSLVIGRDVIIPAPLGPRVNGEDVFVRAMEERLKPLGLRLHFVDIWEPYHTRSGEIHCATNAVRRLRKTDWWKEKER